MKTYNSISEIKTTNKDKGFYFFEPNSMRFFKSKIYPELINGNIFITSEKFDENSDRLFTVRCCLSTGAIEELSKFQAFKTKQAALKYAKGLPIRISEAMECAKDQFNGKRKDKGLTFVDFALIEPTNSQTQSFCMDTFAGACTWLAINWQLTNNSWLESYANQYKERLISEYA